MSVPGSNLLQRALRLIKPQSCLYYRFKERAKQPNGIFLPTYCTPSSLLGSIQPVPRSLYEMYGLDFQKNFFIFYVSKDVTDVERDVAGDIMVFASNTFQAESKTDWFVQDGWDAILCVQVPAISQEQVG